MSPRVRESRPGGHRAAEGLATTTSVPPTTHEHHDDTRARRAGPAGEHVPALHEMTPRAQAIALAWYEIGHREGYEAAERHHWRLPSYSEAVASCIALGTVGIDRAEHARRRREGS